MKQLFVTIALCFAYAYCYAQQDSVIPFEKAYKRLYTITKTESQPVMDGRLDEDFWTKQGEWTEYFVQTQPLDRVPSTSPTRAKLFYDNKYIYVGVYCKDDHPDKTIRFIGNRDDNTVGDLISIALDPYHDYRAASEFNINVGGTKTDLVVTDKLEINRSWNAVWEGRTHVNVTDSSWTAELRIPFSQLRYNRISEDGFWGLHIRRVIRRNNEVQNWSMIPLKNNGHVFSFGVMNGMNDLPKPRGIEFLPYVMGKFRKEPQIPGSPYQKGQRWEENVGLDAKFAISDFTLDVTINPDFGQIELDPSVMNLTAYETFYDEKRPFFLEGKHILDYTSGSDMMFYTRRIGAAPSYSPSVDQKTSFTQTKGNVPILGALKLTGTNRNGVTIGLIQSVTARSSALTTRDGIETRDAVEPLSNYTVARIQKNWKGNTLLGGMFTSVNRALGDYPHLQDFMVRNAFTAGIDFNQYFNNRLYYLDIKGMFSSLNGSAKAIERLQQSAVHYYQRESASGYLKVDPNRTSMNGTGGYAKFGRKGNSKWLFTETFTWYSPGFDLNNVGYLKQADILSANTEVAFRRTDIWKIFRSNTVTLTQINQWDFGGSSNLNNIALTWKTMFLNRFELTASETFAWNYVDTRKLRGGPDLRYDPYFRTTANFNTDKARRFTFLVNYINEYNTDKAGKINTITPSLTYRFNNHVHLTGEFTYTNTVDNTQYVTSAIAAAPYSSVYIPGYIMGKMDQNTYGITMKLQVNVTPDISLQFYGSPFTSTAHYSDFKLSADTRSKARAERFHTFTPEEISLDNDTYTSQLPSTNIRFKNPDFNFNEFRSNVIGRWEYRPGATLYVVWEHRMSSRNSHYVPAWNDNLDYMFGLPSTNTFMLKLNYWFNL
ncbi:hypothetical protein FACS189416_2940 [Bacteroidia bacterium]|nr:hypothetical protein FACS189416_2940 [Bacteroidia bacterium]